MARQPRKVLERELQERLRPRLYDDDYDNAVRVPALRKSYCARWSSQVWNPTDGARSLIEGRNSRGGFGSRLAEEASVWPKPMAEIGGVAILWYIMKIFDHYGFKDFVIARLQGRDDQGIQGKLQQSALPRGDQSSHRAGVLR